MKQEKSMMKQRFSTLHPYITSHPYPLPVKERG
jgi:hypothetical protein